MSEGDNERLIRLERQVDFLFRHFGIDPGMALGQRPPMPSSLYDAISQGKLVQAIKIYRQATGAGLVEAKRAVEAMARQTGR